VASVTVAAVALLQGWRRSDPSAAALKRFAARTLLYAGIPSYVVMRIAADWILSKERRPVADAAWVGHGRAAADLGLLLLLIATIVVNMAVRRDPTRASAGWPRWEPASRWSPSRSTSSRSGR
jgi:hypothetical protein